MGKRLNLGLLVSAALVTGSLLSPVFADDAGTKPTDAVAANAVSDPSESAKSATDDVATKAAERLLGYAKTTARRSARHHRRTVAYRTPTRVAWNEPIRPFYRNIIFLGVGF